jgi:hypothetical protein
MTTAQKRRWPSSHATDTPHSVRFTLPHNDEDDHADHPRRCISSSPAPGRPHPIGIITLPIRHRPALPNDGRKIPPPTAGWTRSDILGYIDYCRQRVRDTLDGMTDEKAAAPLPPAHRYHGQPHAWILTGAVGHTIEHGSQIRQFITAGGISADTQG